MFNVSKFKNRLTNKVIANIIKPHIYEYLNLDVNIMRLYRKAVHMKQSTKAILSVYCVSLQNILNACTSIIMAYLYVAYANFGKAAVVQIITIPSLIALFVSFLVGPISTKISKKNLLIFGLCCNAVNGIILYLGAGIYPLSYLLIGASFFGVGRALVRTLMPAIIAENVPREKVADFNGYLNAITNVGGVAMATLGGFLAAGGNYRNIFLLYLILVPIILITIFYMPKDKITVPDAASTVKKESFFAVIKKLPAKFWIISTWGFLMVVAMYGPGLYFSGYVITEFKLGTTVMTSLVSNIALVSGVFWGLVTGILLKLLKQWSIPVITGICAIAYLLPYFSHSFFAISFCMGLMFLGLATVNSIIIHKICAYVEKEQATVVVSINQGLVNLGSYFAGIVIIFVTGLLPFKGTFSANIATCGALTVILFVASLFIFLKEDVKKDIPAKE